jgi:hypothetical protein
VAKGTGSNKPVASSGKLESVLDAGTHWACEVSLNLPDKGAVKVLASTNPEAIVPALPIDVELVGSRDLAFAAKTTDFGMGYFASDSQTSLKFTNRAKSPISCWPVVRLNGSQVYLDRKAVPRLPITLEPGKSVSLPLVLSLRKLSEGPHALQVNFLEDPLSRLTTFDVKLSAKTQSRVSAAE